MNGEFVEALNAALAKPAWLGKPADPRLLAPQGWNDMTPKPPAVAPLVVGTLTGLVEYLKANRDGLTLENLIVHVSGPGLVEVRGPLQPQQLGRHAYLAATTALVGEPAFKFGAFVDVETFVIGLQVGFVATPHRDQVVALVSAIKESTVRDTFDDGYAQQVTTAGGVTLVGTQRVPNPVLLAPYRTFREVDQPVSPFVLRVRSGKEGERPLIALFEADGGSWKLEAIQNIAGMLGETLPAGVSVIA